MRSRNEFKAWTAGRTITWSSRSRSPSCSRGCGPCFAATSPSANCFLRADDLQMDLLARRVTRRGANIELTGREYELLEYLLRNKNEAVTRDMIAREVWKETTGAMTRIIDVYINALRKKIEHPGCRQLIHTVRGIGYALKDGS